MHNNGEAEETMKGSGPIIPSRAFVEKVDADIFR